MKIAFFPNPLRLILECIIFLVIMLPGGIDITTARCEENIETNTGVRTLYLIRHGDYDHEDESDPDVGKALIPLGVAQARFIASRLRALPVEISSLHSSTMTRARQTAMVIAREFPGLELQQSRLIRECIPPTWREDIMAEEEPAELQACKNLLDEAYSKYFVPSPDTDRHDVIVCHGNVIRYFVTKVLGVDTMSWLQMTIGNCSLTVIRIMADGAMKLISFNDTGHIPYNMYTETGSINEDRYLKVPE